MLRSLTRDIGGGEGGQVQMKMYFCDIPQKLCEIQKKFLIYIHALPGQYGVLEKNHSDVRHTPTGEIYSFILSSG